MIKTKRPSFRAFRIVYNEKTHVLFSDVSISLPYALTGEEKEWSPQGDRIIYFDMKDKKYYLLKLGIL